MIYLFACVGVLLGSFVNALVWRLHEQGAGYEDEPTGAKSADQRKLQQELSILKGRSMCPHCRHTLAGKDLVPVFSWLYLRGRCRYCQKPISRQYPLIELLTATLFAVSWLLLPEAVRSSHILASSFFMLLVLGMALAVYDAKWFVLPNRLVYPFNLLSLVLTAGLALTSHSWQVFWIAVGSALLLYAIFRGIFEVSKGKWLGYGDVRLVVGLGLILGSPMKAMLGLFVASLLGTFWSLPSVLRGRNTRQAQVPFGPFLLIGTYVVFLLGQQALDWYVRQL